MVENGVAHLHKITITTDYGTEVEVNEGVKDGDKVILQPPVNLADGDKVRIISEPPEAERRLSRFRAIFNESLLQLWLSHTREICSGRPRLGPHLDRVDPR